MTLWSVPYRKCTYYSESGTLLASLHQAFQSSPSIALTGLGGMGKTALAIEYAYRYHESYEAILWLDASSLVQVNAGLALLARSDARILSKLWQKHVPWLVILDNVVHAESAQKIVSSLVPSPNEGHILIILQSMQSTYPMISLPALSREESISLVLRRSTLEQVSTEGELQAATLLAKEMDGFPLALEQAGAYLEEIPCSLSSYLDLYHQERKALLSRRGHVADSMHPASVTVTLQETRKRLAPAARELLHILSFFPSHIIANSLLSRMVTQHELFSYPQAFHEARADLLNLFLIQSTDDDRTSINRIVQAVVMDGLPKKQQRRYRNMAQMEGTVD